MYKVYQITNSFWQFDYFVSVFLQNYLVTKTRLQQTSSLFVVFVEQSPIQQHMQNIWHFVAFDRYVVTCVVVKATSHSVQYINPQTLHTCLLKDSHTYMFTFVLSG